MAPSENHGKIPIVKSSEFKRWKDSAAANANHLVLGQSRNGTTKRSSNSPP